jgi:4-amino-4-deoxy-L-arabinose transferase-like glycosyltransferase
VFLALCLLYTLVGQLATNSLRATIGDATLFAYGGRLVLNGAIPYRDFWDNKPPLIFYIEALGYWLFGTTWLGPTLVQALAFVSTVLAFAWLGRLLHPTARAARMLFLGLCTFGLSLPVFVMDGANLTENYLLLLVAVCIALLDPWQPEPRPLRWLLAGGVAGTAFLLRPNAISLGALALACLVFHGSLLEPWSRRVRGTLLLCFALGGAAPLLVTTAYFGLHGAAGEFWFATTVYNLTAYHELFLARASLFEARRYFMFDAQFGIGALLIATAIAFPLTLSLCLRLPAKKARQSLARLALGLVWFAADFGLVLATGHPYAHYVLMLFPSAAFAASELLVVYASGRRVRWLERAVRGVGLGALFVKLYPLAALMPAQISAGARRAAWPAPTVDQQLALWIRPLVTPSDPILNLGHYYGHMMYLGNPPAVSLLSTYHMKSNYGADRWAPEYLKVLTEASPKVLVISDMYWNPHVPSLGAFFRSPDQYRTQILAKVRQNYLQVRYPFEGRFLFVRKGLAAPAPAPLVSPASDPNALWF